MENKILHTLQGAVVRIHTLSITCRGDMIDLSMSVSTDNKSLLIRFRNTSRISMERISPPIDIQGFEIIYNKHKGWEQDSNYLIHDCEDNQISFYCEDIEVETASQIN